MMGSFEVQPLPGASFGGLIEVGDADAFFGGRRERGG